MLRVRYGIHGSDISLAANDYGFCLEEIGGKNIFFGPIDEILPVRLSHGYAPDDVFGVQ